MMTFGNMREIGVRTLAPLLFVTSLLAEPVHAAFYLGRLPARDDKTYWNDVIGGRIAEMRERARSMIIYTRCTDFYLSQIK
jgi:hypothetical protein